MARDGASAGAVGSVTVPMGLWYSRLCSFGYWRQGESSQGRLRIWRLKHCGVSYLARVAVAPTASRPTVLYCDIRLLYIPSVLSASGLYCVSLSRPSDP